MSLRFQKIYLLFQNFVGYLVSDQVSRQSVTVLYPEKSMVGVISPFFTPFPSLSPITRSTYVGGNRVNWDLIEPSDTWNYNSFFKHFILQTILHVFLLFIFLWSKVCCCKNSRILHVFDLVRVASGVTLLKFLCLWCSLFKVTGSPVSFGCSRYNCLGRQKQSS